MPVTRSTTIKMEDTLKQLMKMIQKGQEEMKKSQENMETKIMTSMKTELKKFKEDMIAEFRKSCEDLKNEPNNTQETTKDSQETMKTELRTEVEEKVEAIEEKADIIEETATGPKSEVKEDVQRIESEAEEKREELNMENEWVERAKPNGTTDSNKDATTDNAEQKPESNDNAKEGESSGSVAANGSNDIPENEEETTNPQVVWEDLQLAKRIYQKRGEEDKIGLAGAIVKFGEVSLEGGNFESAISDIKEGLRKQNEIAASTVQEQRKKLRRSQEGRLHATVTELNDSVWRIPQRPRVKMRFVRLKLFEGSTDGVT